MGTPLCFSAIFSKGNNFLDSLFTSLEDKALSNGMQSRRKKKLLREYGFPPVRGDNVRDLVSGLSTCRRINCGITILLSVKYFVLKFDISGGWYKVVVISRHH